METAESYAQRLRLSNLLREPALAAAVDTLDLPAGSRGLDAGCGIGLHTTLLAQAVGPAGHVTGFDISPDLLARAEQRADNMGLAACTSFAQGDVNKLPFKDGVFDWAWSADTVYAGPVGDPFAITRELARVVRPGGPVAVAFWSAQKLLPGYPHLEAQLDALFALAAPYLGGIAPEMQFTGALGWLRRAGLVECSAHTFAANICAPLAAETRAALAMTFDMLWASACHDLPHDDQALYARLRDPASPGCILNNADYCGFLTYSLFIGRARTGAAGEAAKEP